MKLLPIGSVFIGGLGVVFSNPGYGASFGDPADDPLQSSATICMAVGARAALTGFDNFRLEPVNTDGPAGSLYAGSDSFELDSNAPVRVIIDGEYLNNGEHEIDSWFSIDGNRNHFDTSSEGAHKGVHTFSARAQLGRCLLYTSGDDSVETEYSLDGGSKTFDTATKSVHNAKHTVAAAATLGEISSQQAGAYSSVITLTVSAI